jgi:hypothetical protein
MKAYLAVHPFPQSMPSPSHYSSTDSAYFDQAYMKQQAGRFPGWKKEFGEYVYRQDSPPSQLYSSAVSSNYFYPNPSRKRQVKLNPPQLQKPSGFHAQHLMNGDRHGLDSKHAVMSHQNHPKAQPVPITNPSSLLHHHTQRRMRLVSHQLN